jgi:hypothetical protein
MRKRWESEQVCLSCFLFSNRWYTDPDFKVRAAQLSKLCNSGLIPIFYWLEVYCCVQCTDTRGAREGAVSALIISRSADAE